MALRVRAKVLLHMWSYDFMTRHYPLNNSDAIISIKKSVETVTDRHHEACRCDYLSKSSFDMLNYKFRHNAGHKYEDSSLDISYTFISKYPLKSKIRARLFKTNDVVS